MEKDLGPHGPTREDFRRAESAYLRARNAEARCLIGPQSECSVQLVEAHSIQKAKLILIADKRRKLQILSIDVIKDFSMASAMENERDKIFRQYRSISNPIITGKWACKRHDDSTFSQIEKGNLDAANEEHCLLLAYRTVLFDYFKKCVILRFYKELGREFQTTVFSSRISISAERKALAERFKIQVENALIHVRNGRNSGMEHRIIVIKSVPKIAANVVTYREGRNMGTPREERKIAERGIIRSPSEILMFVTVYPEPDRNVAILSFPKGWDSLVHVYIPAFWEEDTNLASALLSKTILDETEGIMISPAAWRSFGEKKQRRIIDQFVVTTQPDPMVVRTRSGESIPEEVLSNLLYRRDPDFVDNSDPEEFNLFSD